MLNEAILNERSFIQCSLFVEWRNEQRMNNGTTEERRNKRRNEWTKQRSKEEMKELTKKPTKERTVLMI